MDEAPFYNDLSEGPEKGAAYWLNTSDGVRVRVGHWPGTGKGTVFLFPGRTEYVEKYGRTARDLHAHGYGTLSIDWRGQGLSDRLSKDVMQGDVDQFSDYQRDVAAMVAFAEEQNLPKPWYLMAHSMGGCIGLRALHNGLPVNAAVFSAPMWGIGMAPILRPAAWIGSFLGRNFGFANAYAPGTKPVAYVLENPFEDNSLTGDPDVWDYMKRQVLAIEKFKLGGPSMRWLFTALCEARHLRAMGLPKLPIATFLGTDETIVHVGSIHQVMKSASLGKLHVVENARHEFPMEKDPIRAQFLDESIKLYSANA